MNEPLKRYHKHPAAIFQYTYRYLYLLCIPLLRGVRYISTPRGLYHWAQGAWLDLTVVGLLLLLPMVAWRCYTYRFSDEGMEVYSGIFLRRYTLIPLKSIITLGVERPWYLRLIGAVRLTLDTDAGLGQQSDLSLIITRKRAKYILSRYRLSENTTQCYRPRWYQVAVLSVLVSNSLSGVFLLATTFQQTGRLLGERFQESVLGNLEHMAAYIHLIPKTAAVLSLVVIGGWMLGAIRNLIRYSPLAIYRTQSRLVMRTGWLVRRDYACDTSSVNYVDYRQSIFSKILRLHMIFIDCIGYQKGKNGLSVFIPVAPVKRSEQALHRLLPEFRRHPLSLKASFLSWYRYVFYPLWGIVFLTPISGMIGRWFPQWSELIYYLTIMALVPLVWQMAVKTIDRCTAGISYQEGYLTMSYSRWFTFHTVIVPAEKVVGYRFSATPFQKMAKNCDVWVYTYGERLKPHRIKNVKTAKAQQLMADLPKR